MKVIFLAAGIGSRLKKGKLSNKCLITVNEKVLMNSLLEKCYSENIFNILIVTGHNYKKLIRQIKYANINFRYNKLYRTHNIGSSIAVGLYRNKSDCLISYSDITYEKKILKFFNKIKTENFVIPVLKNWQKVWKQRQENIYNDAENLFVKNGKVIEIGKKISNLSKVKYQFMGLLYVPKSKSSLLRRHIYKYNLLNKDTTYILNSLITNNILVEYYIYDGLWYEFDKLKDVRNFKRFNYFL